MIPINIIGEDGNFGSHLKNLLRLQIKEQIEFRVDADNVILAVPLDAYEQVAKANSGKHLINVCSVQHPSTEICLKYSNKVTSIHPLFGARTPLTVPRVSIITYETPGCSILAYRIFFSISEIVTSDTETHDRHMAKTHLQVVLLHDQIRKIMEKAKDVPDHFLTPSFKKLKDLSEGYLDMPEGTKTSILANPYAYEQNQTEFDRVLSDTLDELRMGK